jgi:hypothetical protein
MGTGRLRALGHVLGLVADQLPDCALQILYSPKGISEFVWIPRATSRLVFALCIGCSGKEVIERQGARFENAANLASAAMETAIGPFSRSFRRWAPEVSPLETVRRIC